MRISDWSSDVCSSDLKSQSYDATFEYYFKGGYVAIAGYYRDITNRVITSAAVEMYDGDPYAVSRPRNVGQATLKGVELSSQRSEEHTSELQSLMRISYAVFCLKKKKKTKNCHTKN